jgi:hypothetical protein
MFHGYSGDFRKSTEYEQQARRLSQLSRNENMVDEARARLTSVILWRHGHRLTRLDREATLADRANSSCGCALGLGSGGARITVRKILATRTYQSWAQGYPCATRKVDALITPLRLAGLPE